jgi:hypothetical protein
VSPAENDSVAKPSSESPSNFENRYFWSVSFLFLCAITLPYLWAWAITPNGMGWSGLLWKADDQNVHLAWARQAQDGHLFFRDLFTTEGLVSGERPLFFNLLPLAWGLLAHTGLPLIFWYHLTRVGAALATLWQFHRLAQLVLPTVRERVISIWLIALATGSSFAAVAVPWLYDHYTFIDHPDPTKNFPFPTMPEAFVFTSAFAYPLNIVAYGLLALLARLVIEPSAKSGKTAALAFGCAFLLSNIHTYDAIPLGLTVLIWILLNKKDRREHLPVRGAILAGLALPVLYQGIVFRGSQEFREKALTLTLPPPLHSIALSLAVLLLPALLGAWIVWKSGSENTSTRGRFVIVWALVTVISIYAPVSFARKMLEGAQLPLALLAAVGYACLAASIANRSIRRTVMIAGAVMLSISPAYFTLFCIQQNDTYMPPRYLMDSEWQALHYLDTKGDRSSAVLSLPLVGSYGPRETGMTFYLAHWAETLHFGDKFKLGLNFYGDRLTPTEARNLLRTNKIRYVIEGQYERLFGKNSSYASDYGLHPIWSSGSGDRRTVIYEIPSAGQ